MAELRGRSTLMCERFTQHYAWEEIHGLYGLPARKPSSEMHPRYKICPTTRIDTVRKPSPWST